MPRTMSLTALQSSIAQEVAETFVEIIEVVHADLPATLRFVSDTADITSGGNLYTAFPFRIAIPNDTEDTLPEVTLIISTIDQAIQNAVRAVTSAPAIALSIIRVSTPDTVEAGPFNFTVLGADYDIHEMRLRLGFNSHFLQESFPKDIFASYNAQ